MVFISVRRTSVRLFGVVLTAFALSSGAILIGADSSDHVLLLPRNATGSLPLLVVLPGKNVPASAELNNWKFSAGKNRFAMIVLDVDYNTIQSDKDVDKFHNRIKSSIDSLDLPGITLDKKKIYLAGTSMGGMMAIALTLRYPKEYVATSVVCGSRLYFGAKQSLANATGRRFYLAHGSDDKVVPIQSFEETKNALESHGALVTAKVYAGGGHIISGAYNESVNWLTVQPEGHP